MMPEWNSSTFSTSKDGTWTLHKAPFSSCYDEIEEQWDKMDRKTWLTGHIWSINWNKFGLFYKAEIMNIIDFQIKLNDFKVSVHAFNILRIVLTWISQWSSATMIPLIEHLSSTCSSRNGFTSQTVFSSPSSAASSHFIHSCIMSNRDI